MSKSIFRREIIAGCIFFIFLAFNGTVLAQSGNQDSIEIFSDGKKYNSIDEYKKYQIKRLQEGISSSKDPKSLSGETSFIKKVSQELAQNLAGPTFQRLDQQKIKEILGHAHSKDLTLKEAAVADELSRSEKTLTPIK